MTDFNKVLIINTSGIGDVLFTTPVVSNLRRANPQGTIAYLANRRVAALLEGNANINRVFVYERDEFVAIYRQSPLKFFQKWFGLYNSIKQQGFDLVLDYSFNSTFGFLTAACGIKRRVGFDFRNRGRFLTDRIPFAGFDDKHVIEYNLDLLHHLQVPVLTKRMTLDIPLQDMKWAKEWLLEHNINPAKPLMAVLPGGGASWGKDAGLKRWAAPKFADLIDKIIENFDADIILLGDSKDVELCRQVVKESHFPLHVAVGETTLSGMAALLNHCRLAILNDGGPLHVAVAVGVKTVSIFGPVDPVVYGPYPAEGHYVVKKVLPCQPCYRRFRMAKCGHISCLGELSVDEVYRKVQNIL